MQKFTAALKFMAKTENYRAFTLTDFMVVLAEKCYEIPKRCEK